MGVKWVKTWGDLRQMGNETEATWEQRQIVAASTLIFINERPRCHQLRLYQNKGLEDLARTPDFTVECKHSILLVIEIGLVGATRREEISGAGYSLVCVKRGSGFNFAQHWTPCHKCPYRPRRGSK